MKKDKDQAIGQHGIMKGQEGAGRKAQGHGLKSVKKEKPENRVSHGDTGTKEETDG